MRSIDEILDAPFDSLTAEEWQRLNAASAEHDPEGQFEAELEAAGEDWDRIGEAIARVLRGE